MSMATEEGTSALSLAADPAETTNNTAEIPNASATAPSGAQTSLDAERVQNAVAFLSHPKVRGSSKESKTAFLERKGLTPAEIEEAFRRVPESGTVATTTSYAQPSTAAPRKPFPTSPTTTALQPVSYASQQQVQSQSYRWSQVVIGASILMAGAYAVKQLLGPYAVGWYRRFYGIEPKAEEVEKQAQLKQTAEIVAEAIQKQTTELRATVESMKDMLTRLEKGKGVSQPPQEGLSVSDLRSELHAFAATIGSLGPQPASGAAGGVEEQLKELKTLLADRLPAAVSGSQRAPVNAYPSYSSGPISNGNHSMAPPASRFPHKHKEPTAQQPAPSPSYMEVLEMLEKGQTPPGIRDDINDKPPNPSQPPPASRAQPRPKPWEALQGRQEPAGGPSQPADGDGSISITEAEDSSSRPSTGSWKPPPIPQASLKHQKSGAEADEGEAHAEASEGQ